MEQLLYAEQAFNEHCYVLLLTSGPYIAPSTVSLKWCCPTEVQWQPHIIFSSFFEI